MQFTDEIAMHECGHVIALAATGLTDEFQIATNVPDFDDFGRPTDGRTDHTRASLNKLSENLTEFTSGQQGGLERFRQFVLTTPDVCLQHLCFYFGGGEIDRFLGRKNPDRNKIDMEQIRECVLPAMFLLSTLTEKKDKALPSNKELLSAGTMAWLSDEDITFIQKKVDEFMSKVFTKEKVLLGRLYSAIVEYKTLMRDNIDPEILNEMRTCAKRSERDYNNLLASVKEWHAEKMSQLTFFKVQ